MEVYTKINTMYKRYQKIGKGAEIPEKYRKMQNLIILGQFSDPEIEYLFDNKFEAFAKIDGTNSKICFWPSTGNIQVGGKTDKASSQHGQFEFLQAIADRIADKLKAMYPPENARFVPVADEWYKPDGLFTQMSTDEFKTAIKNGQRNFGVKMAEVPVYIYGEYYGEGIQKGGGYCKGNRFDVFDIQQQGWWIPSDMRHEICKSLELDEVPFLGIMTLREIEEKVRAGFKTTVRDPNDPDTMEEGIVARPIVPLKSGRGNRIIVKVKSCDYIAYDNARKEFTDEEFEEFQKWYADYEASLETQAS